MPRTSSREVLKHLNTLFHCGPGGSLSDAELLERFVADRDADAFAALVERHGAMVLGVCRRVLGNRDAAEDAFQATFLVLARKASSIARREQVFSWLYGVAVRVALDARTREARQKAREKRWGAMHAEEPPDSTDASELRQLVDEELARLPERYRSALVLCEFEGLSRREAAARLGVSEGTLSSRLARAKTRLKDRLTRRGVTLSAATPGTFLAREAQAVIVPPALVDATIQLAAGSSSAGVVSASVATLTEGVLKAMFLAKFKGVALGLAALAVAATGVTVLAQQPGGPTGGGSNDDRLRAVERKLDKLLDVLERSVANPNLVPAAPPPALSPLPLTAPVAPAVPPPPAAPGPSFSGAPSLTIPRGILPTGPPPVVGPHANPGSQRSLAGRIESLEHRFDDLERRLREIEHRFDRAERANTTPSYTPPASLPETESSRPSSPPSVGASRY